MAILQAAFLALSRRAGQLINTLFGWATQLLFGKVAQNQQISISVMAFGSVAWLISVIGIALPAVGTFLLAFIPLPKWVEHNWVRLIMLIIAAVLPLVIGAVGVKIIAAEEKPEAPGEKIKAVLRGYPYTAGLAITLLLMTLLAPFMILPLLARRWATVHVPLIVEAKEYKAILAEVESTLVAGGWKTVRQPASWMVRMPTKILVSLAGRMVDRFVAEELTTLRGANLEVTLHPADLVISGGRFEVVRVRALLAERLAFSSANQTWTKEANEIENQVTALWGQLRDGKVDVKAARQELARLAQKRDHQDLEFEEWEVLERQQLLVERAALDALLPGGSAALRARRLDRAGQRIQGLPLASTAPVGTKSPSHDPTGEGKSGRYDWVLGTAVFSSFVLLGVLLPKRTTLAESADS